MIRYNHHTGQYESDGNRPPFDPLTYQVMRWYSWAMSWLPHMRSPQDLAAWNGQPLDLCHQVSYDAIERMVIDFLNGTISMTQFAALVGSLFRPTWSEMLFPPTGVHLLAQWTIDMSYRMDLMYRRYTGAPGSIVPAANRLVRALNNVVSNLRYGDLYTNRSISQHFDPRVHNGATLDPFMLATWMYAMGVGSRAFAAETSAAMVEWHGRIAPAVSLPAPPHLPGGIRSSRADRQIGLTGGGNAILGVPAHTVTNPFARSVAPFVPISFDTLVYGLLFLAFFLGLVPEWINMLPRQWRA